jgi:hypothetical protein
VGIAGYNVLQELKAAYTSMAGLGLATATGA